MIGTLLGKAIRTFLGYYSYPVTEFPWTHHSEFVGEFVGEDPASVGGDEGITLN
jgi:hypothetical protein